MSTAAQQAQALQPQDEDLAWALLLAARQCSEPLLPASALALGQRRQGAAIERLASKDADALLVYAPETGWRCTERLSACARDLAELYLPLLAATPEKPLVVGHLGQSLDACIATENGHALYVTGEQNRKHLHRMRALCDAVVVGVSTVVADDPQLTTRAVTGVSPVRVVIDPHARVSQSAGLLQDEAAPTVLVQAEGATATPVNGADIIQLPSGDEGLSIADVLAALHERGLYRIFVEGGGITVSRFMMEGCLDRLQVATAPVLIGAGRPALQLPGAISMQLALRPAYRLYRMGEDILWDFDLSERAVTADNAPEGVQRIF